MDEKEENNLYMELFSSRNYEMINYLVSVGFDIDTGFKLALNIKDPIVLNIFAKHEAVDIDILMQTILSDDSVYLITLFNHSINMPQLLIAAAGHGSYLVVTHLISHVQITFDDWKTALHKAALSGQEEVYFLLRADVEPDETLFIAACKGGNKNIIDNLTDYLPTTLLGSNEAAIHVARYGYIDVIELLVIERDGIDLNRALFNACIYGQTICVRVLFDWGATQINTGLILASRYGRAQTVRELIELGADNIEEAMIEAAHWNRWDVYGELHALFAPYDTSGASLSSLHHPKI